ncbi:MAG TPA: MmcQ/YjbR family DNA-binding protein [Gemmatimonadaceae bacterium]|nr:MmcQ/YjbR family DNA-binding protein [Gemmatimonadaceae bacterium]
MTVAEFRRLALSLPETTEGAHHGYTDFRVAGRIFASLGYPTNEFAVVNLTPQDQDFLLRAHADVLAPVPNKWGASGSTTVRLAKARRSSVVEALEAAWRRRAPKRLVASLENANPGANT